MAASFVPFSQRKIEMCCRPPVLVTVKERLQLTANFTNFRSRQVHVKRVRSFARCEAETENSISICKMTDKVDGKSYECIASVCQIIKGAICKFQSVVGHATPYSRVARPLRYFSFVPAGKVRSGTLALRFLCNVPLQSG